MILLLIFIFSPIKAQSEELPFFCQFHVSPVIAPLNCSGERANAAQAEQALSLFRSNCPQLNATYRELEKSSQSILKKCSKSSSLECREKRKMALQSFQEFRIHVSQIQQKVESHWRSMSGVASPHPECKIYSPLNGDILTQIHERLERLRRAGDRMAELQVFQPVRGPAVVGSAFSSPRNAY